MRPMPEEQIEYLLTMISPPPHEDGTQEKALFLGDADSIDFSKYPDCSVSGLIVTGTPSPETSSEMLRVLKPGGHLMVAAPDEEPTGHTGACNIEDAGFQIRDSILWVHDAGGLHYIPKASRSEREEGLANYPGKTNFETVDREEGSAGLNSPRAGAGRTNSNEIKNFHPCLHPNELVLTDNGFKQISLVQIGDQVYSEDGKFHTVEDVSSHAYTSSDLYQIQVMGTNIKTLASDNHPFKIWRPIRKGKSILGGEVQWVSSDSIQKGDYTMTPILSQEITSPTNPIHQSPDFWYLCGLWTAEGVLQQAGHGDHVYPSFSFHKKESYFVGRLNEFFTPRGVQVSVYPKPDCDGMQVMAFDPEIGAEFYNLCGKGSRTKTLHPSIFSLPLEFRKSFLDGYLAGDGSKVRKANQAKTSSPNLAGQLRLLGDSVGYDTSMYWFDTMGLVTIMGRSVRSNPHYQLYFQSENLKRLAGKKKPMKPLVHEIDGVVYRLNYVKGVVKIPYQGDVWNLSVEGSPTFQTSVGMSHNTVKPNKLMRRLIVDIPTDEGPVIDPFLGSGSTGIACVYTGHDFIGIEMEEEHIPICDGRILHHKDIHLSTQGNLNKEIVLISDGEHTRPDNTPKIPEGFDFFND